MDVAIRNRTKVQMIRRRMLSGEITYEEAKAEAQPIIDQINETAARLAKKHGIKARGKVSFAAMMR